MIVRPEPKAFEADNIAKGKVRADTGISASWFTKGGLEWDGQQLKLWDADGDAHVIPVAPNGAIVRNTSVFVNNGAHRDVLELFVGDGTKHMVAALPIHGFEHTDFSELATAAGLQFLQTRHGPGDPDFMTSGYPTTDATLDLKKSVKSSTDGSVVSRLFGRHHGDS
jgi:hypothetical protein